MELVDGLPVYSFEELIRMHDDIEEMERFGYYKNGVPEWAKDLSERLRCQPASNGLLLYVYEQLARELRKRVLKP